MLEHAHGFLRTEVARAVKLRSAPVIGVPLPLVSYGGSQLMANLVALGLLLNVSMRRYMF
jgi:cell division protein FtsW (lipid II flippase)